MVLALLFTAAQVTFPFIHTLSLVHSQMLISVFSAPPLTTLCNTDTHHIYSLFSSNSFNLNHKLILHSSTRTRPDLILANASSSSSPAADTCLLQSLNPNPNSDALCYVTQPTGSDDEPQETMVPSASAVASAIRKASNSPVEFIQRIEKDRKGGLLLPSPDFHRLCLEQLHLFRRMVPEAVLSVRCFSHLLTFSLRLFVQLEDILRKIVLQVYVRPAGSYVMDRLELRRVTLHPRADAEDIVILVGHFTIPTGLRAAEATLSNLQV